MITAYKYDSEGVYVSPVTLYESPREPGTYPMPPNTTLLSPSTVNDVFSDGAWTTPVVTRTPETAETEKLSEINLKFSESTTGPFYVNDMCFDHGMNSILKIFLAIRKSEQMGEETRTIYESDETPHTMTIAEAYEVATEIGDDYDKKDAMMRAYKKALTDIMASAQTDEDKVTNIDAINVSYELTEEV
jgi:hypothetical protein